MTFTLLPSVAAIFMLIFARVGTMVMLMPAIGEVSVPARVRLGIAVVLTMIFFPLVSDAYHVREAIPDLVGALAIELAVGFVIGVTGRMLMGALQTAGVIIANQLGLGFVTAVDPNMGQQGAIMSAFLSLLAVTLIFAGDLHYLALAAVYDSYQLFVPGKLPPIGDATQLIVQTFAGAFRIAMQVSAPFLVFGIIFNAGLGILAKLMPQMQVFFVALPATIMLGLLLFAVVIGAIMATYLGFLEEGLRTFIVK